MTAAYRLKGIGWMAVLVGIVLGFYLISLRVAAERKTLDDVNARVETAERDIRALETEFDTRANLAQLERWNGDTLALAAPTAAQFIRDDAALAAINPGLPGGPAVQTAALVVPSLPVTPAALAPAPQPPAAPRPAVAATKTPAAPTPTPRPAPAPGPLQMAAARRPAPVKAAVERSAVAVAQVTAEPRARRVATSRATPAQARLAEKAQEAPAIAKVHPQAVAMLDGKLLSDSTFGDILTGARAEARGRR